MRENDDERRSIASNVNTEPNECRLVNDFVCSKKDEGELGIGTRDRMGFITATAASQCMEEKKKKMLDACFVNRTVASDQDSRIDEGRGC